MNNKKEKPSNEPGYRPIGIDPFSPDGETYYLTEADCLEPAEGWGNEEWSDEDIRRENGDDWD